MKGLGIVLEESESPHPTTLSPSPSISDSRHKDREALLPPLPDADPDAIIATPVVPQLLNSPTASHMGHLPSRHLQQDGEDPFLQPPSKAMADIFSDLLLALYDLDLLALADSCTSTLAFPTVETSSGLALARSQTPVLLPTVNTGMSTLGPGPPGLIGSASCTNVNSNASGAVVLATCSSGCMAGCANCSHQPQNSNSTLPLKRLKSLKMGIRKLSLPKLGGSLSLLPTPVVELLPQLVRPMLLPQHTDINLQDDTLLSLAGESLRLSTFSASMGYAGMGAGISTTVSTPGAPTHGYSSSGGLGLGLGLALLVSKQRQRALLNPTLTPQATVTVLGNMGQSKKNLQDLEQIFLNSLAEEASASDSASSPLSPNSSSVHQLSTSDELIEFLMFLNEHKKSVESAFEMAKQRFTSSGWCLNHDIVNLGLQRDTSLSLIDTKLLQIEERLNSEFNLLMLNNPCTRLGLTWPASASESASPSAPLAVPSSLNLKNLESKCYAREAANGVRENAFA